MGLVAIIMLTEYIHPVVASIQETPEAAADAKSSECSQNQVDRFLQVGGEVAAGFWGTGVA